VNEEGVISHVLPANSPTSVQLLENSPGQTLHIIPDGSFLLPTFCDLHLHAPQFLYQGTGLDLPLMQWLDNYALKSEARMDEKLGLGLAFFFLNHRFIALSSQSACNQRGLEVS
jgi:guanine deaminase